MAVCCICGKSVPAAMVMHGSCWARKVEETAQIFCDHYCRWPLECGSQEELDERCDSCVMIRLGSVCGGAEDGGRRVGRPWGAPCGEDASMWASRPTGE